jgi:hypothetical protein
MCGTGTATDLTGRSAYDAFSDGRGLLADQVWYYFVVQQQQSCVYERLHNKTWKRILLNKDIHIHYIPPSSPNPLVGVIQHRCSVRAPYIRAFSWCRRRCWHLYWRWCWRWCLRRLSCCCLSRCWLSSCWPSSCWLRRCWRRSCRFRR